jgi:hypothetical protein
VGKPVKKDVMVKTKKEEIIKIIPSNMYVLIDPPTIIGIKKKNMKKWDELSNAPAVISINPVTSRIMYIAK